MKKETREKFTKVTFICTIFILIFVSGYLIYLFFFEPIESQIAYYLMVFFIAMMFWFIYALIVGLTRYKKEFLLNDIELKRNWKRISPAYKKFQLNTRRTSIIFFLIMGFLGLVEVLIFKDIFKVYLILIGFGFALLDYREIRKLINIDKNKN